MIVCVLLGRVCACTDLFLQVGKLWFLAGNGAVDVGINFFDGVLPLCFSEFRARCADDGARFFGRTSALSLLVTARGWFR